MEQASVLGKLGFSPSGVQLRDKRQNWIRGRFCFLRVDPLPPRRAGVYAWVVENEVKYVGAVKGLLHIVRGSSTGEPFLDQTNICGNEEHAELARFINNQLRQIVYMSEVTWWWKVTVDFANALTSAASLEQDLSPDWNAKLAARRREKRDSEVAKFRARSSEPTHNPFSKVSADEPKQKQTFVHVVPGGLPGLGRGR